MYASSTMDSTHQNPNFTSPQSPSLSRLWRPSAQRNLRNQWSKLSACRQQWNSSTSDGRCHATSLVNSYLSQRYMPAMDLGVLKDMPDIRKKACLKLFRQQELHRSKLLSSYKDMVDIVARMMETSRSMRCFLKETDCSSRVQFSNSAENKSDLGDGGGIQVFTFLSISSIEKLAQEAVEMFVLELNLKRLIVVELLNISCEEGPDIKTLGWCDEIYRGEFDALGICNLYSKETNILVPPALKGFKSDMSAVQSNSKPDHNVLQVYLTAWLAAVNVDTYRLDEIFSMIEEEMKVKFC